MHLLLVGLAAFCATFLGGSLAFRMRDHLHLILGFSAGAVLGVAFFDLIPETFAYGTSHYGPRVTALVVSIGFAIFLVLDRLAQLQAAALPEINNSGAQMTTRGALGASSLVAHSAFDGIAIGFAFQISSAIGIIVTAAVLTHDFSDGINTMNIVLKNSGTAANGFRWLLADALAPIAGIAATLMIPLPQALFGLILALFAGFFLYLGASDLLPESHRSHPRAVTTVATIIGMAVVYSTVSNVSR